MLMEQWRQDWCLCRCTTALCREPCTCRVCALSGSALNWKLSAWHRTLLELVSLFSADGLLAQGLQCDEVDPQVLDQNWFLQIFRPLEEFTKVWCLEIYSNNWFPPKPTIKWQLTDSVWGEARQQCVGHRDRTRVTAINVLIFKCTEKVKLGVLHWPIHLE